MNSRTTPYLLAGRSDKVDSPHALWQAINFGIADEKADFWERVRRVSIATGFIDGQCDVEFKMQVVKLIDNASIPSPKAEDLLKRVRELEIELAA